MRFTLLVTLAALLGALIFSPVRSSAASEDIVDIGAIDRVSGWLSTADRLYLTRDRGASWQVVTPDPASGERVLAATGARLGGFGTCRCLRPTFPTRPLGA